MDDQLFHFFENPEFDKCFFSGELVSPGEKIPVFPEWLLDRYDLRDKYMGMLNWNRVKYGELFVPCSDKVKDKVLEVEKIIEDAFKDGYDKVKESDSDVIFIWMSKLLLTILYHDIERSIEISRKRRRPYKLSGLLTRKFSILHFMVQSLVRPVRWTVKPYSLLIKELNYSKDIFNFRDETNNLNFSLGMNGFGLVACLQDLGANMVYHTDLLEKIGDTPLHAIQFEELCARFAYSNYILRENSGWHVELNDDNIYEISPLDPDEKPVFGTWDDKMFGSTLLGYWEPWGLDPKDVYTFPEPPMSFLVDEGTNKFIHPEDIPLET